MIRLWIGAFAALTLVITVGTFQDVSAASNGVVIQAVRAASTSSAADEFVIVRNISSMAVDIANWKIIYSSASGGTNTTLVTFSAASLDHILLPSTTSETVFSTSLAQSMSLPIGTTTFTAGMNPAGGTITLRAADGSIVDRVGWGTATLVETTVAPALGNQILLRQATDSDNNSVDFGFASQSQIITLDYGGLLEVTDVCANLDGIQLTIPEGLVRSADATCLPPDICNNLEGIQSEVPPGYELQQDGSCQLIDRCQNIDGVQTDSSVYEVIGQNCYPPFVPAALRVTELLPNPSGQDQGNEFIEIYNADSFVVNLDDYYLEIEGVAYHFPVGRTLPPGSYVVFSDTELNRSFTNATGKEVLLVGRDHTIIDRLPVYTNAPDDQTWALIDGEWQYTNQPTPGEANIASIIFGSGVVTPTLAACPAGKYRNPETNRCKSYETSSLSTCAAGQERNPATNRCRKIVTATASLATCKEGQYRNPLTNRCKSIAAELSSLTPCKEGQYRNPETNRCRKLVTSTAELAACPAGQERNPATNRCRKQTSLTPSAAAFPVEPIADTTATFTAWWALGGVLALGLGYGAWEYRHEIRSLVQRIVTRGKV